MDVSPIVTVVADLTNKLNALKGIVLPPGAPAEIGQLATEIANEIGRLAQYSDPPPTLLVKRVTEALLALRELIDMTRLAHAVKKQILRKKEKAADDLQRLGELAVEEEAERIASEKAARTAREAALDIASEPAPPPPSGMVVK